MQIPNPLIAANYGVESNWSGLQHSRYAIFPWNFQIYSVKVLYAITVSLGIPK